MGYDRIYYLKKAFALYPGVLKPRSAAFLEEHYEHRRMARSSFRKLVDAAIGAGFHLWVPLRARQVGKRLGYDAAWVRRTARIARQRFADPNDIALFRIEEAEQLDHYLRRFEDAALNKRLNPAGWQPGCALADKVLFYRRCAQHGLPHPQMIAVVEHGEPKIVTASQGSELLAKPADGEGGSGVQLLGSPHTGGELEALLKERLGTAKGKWVVQPKVANHLAIAPIALNALATVRIVTILNEHGAPEVVSATFRCASDPSVAVDNMKAGGLLSAVNLQDGTLGIACKGYGGGDYASHPVTEELIAGRTLPHWKECCALVIKAHASAFGEYRIIGWDVAITPDGPLLIEGNGKPGVLMPQRAARQGIGATRYGGLLRYNLAIVDKAL